MTPSLQICRLAEVVSEVRQHYTLETLVSEKGGLIVDSLRCFEPVQLAEERGDVVIPRRGKHQQMFAKSQVTHISYVDITVNIPPSVGASLSIDSSGDWLT